jgi:hypothetical protein
VSIRLRVAVVFTLALASAFALLSWLLVSRLSAAELSSVDAQLATQLSQASRYVHHGSGSPASPASAPAPGEYDIQVIDASGRVQGASPDTGTTPLLSAADLRQARSGQIGLSRTIDGDPERLLAAPFPGPGHHGWVAVAGVSQDSVDSSVRVLSGGLLIGGAAFVLAAGAGAYWLARAALSPVERMRREVAALSERGTQSSVRVPRTRDEIAALATTMNDLLTRLHLALARQRSFVADASHELRTPFAVLQGELELAGRPGRSREELAAAVANAADEAARLTRITDDLLLLASSDEERLTLRPERTKVATLLNRAAEVAAARAAAAGVSCRVDAPPELEARVDPGRVRQAVDNLIDNALRFAPPGTEIVIGARIVGPELVIEVRDAGPGFPAEFIPHAFERFRRPDSGRARSDGGAGLGLAIVHAIAMAHGGRATVGNDPEGGAVVRLELPVTGGC